MWMLTATGTGRPNRISTFESTGAGGESGADRGPSGGTGKTSRLILRHWCRRPGWWASTGDDEAPWSLKQRLKCRWRLLCFFRRMTAKTTNTKLRVMSPGQSAVDPAGFRRAVHQLTVNACWSRCAACWSKVKGEVHLPITAGRSGPTASGADCAGAGAWHSGAGRSQGQGISGFIARTPDYFPNLAEFETGFGHCGNARGAGGQRHGVLMRATGTGGDAGDP